LLGATNAARTGAGIGDWLPDRTPDHLVEKLVVDRVP
jgi:hypothetical protein